MNFKILICVSAAFAVGVCLPSAQNYQTQALDKHNTLRAKHSSGKMTLDDNLNSIAEWCAKDYATRKKIDHKCSKKQEGQGENLYMSSQSGSAPDPSVLIDRAITAWYNENADYFYDDPGRSDRNNKVTGHFTQEVWKATTKLGCGAASVGQINAVCCLYTPQGNIRWGNGDVYREYKTNVLKPN